VSDLTDAFELSQPTVSHHLKVLHDTGLLDRSKRGIWVYPDGNEPARQEDLTASRSTALNVQFADAIHVAFGCKVRMSPRRTSLRPRSTSSRPGRGASIEVAATFAFRHPAPRTGSSSIGSNLCCTGDDWGLAVVVWSRELVEAVQEGRAGAGLPHTTKSSLEDSLG